MNNQGQANRMLISNSLMIKDVNNLRNDNVFVANEVRNFKDVTGINARKGLDRVILSNGEIVNVVSKSYGHLPNEIFFAQVENMLLEADIKTATRSINRENRSFAVDHILNDESLAITVKNSTDKLLPMLRFTNSYDGSCRTTGSFGVYRMVCENRLFVAQSQVGFSIKHRGEIAEVVMPNIKHLISKFMDNEYYTLKRKFEVLAEKPITNIEEYVKMTCDDLKIFMYEASKENAEPSLNARMVIDIVNRESRQLQTGANAWILYNSFNEILHSKLKKSFGQQKDMDGKLFDYMLQMAN